MALVTRWLPYRKQTFRWDMTRPRLYASRPSVQSLLTLSSIRYKSFEGRRKTRPDRRSDATEATDKYLTLDTSFQVPTVMAWYKPTDRFGSNSDRPTDRFRPEPTDRPTDRPMQKMIFDRPTDISLFGVGRPDLVPTRSRDLGIWGYA